MITNVMQKNGKEFYVKVTHWALFFPIAELAMGEGDICALPYGKSAETMNETSHTWMWISGVQKQGMHSFLPKMILSILRMKFNRLLFSLSVQLNFISNSKPIFPGFINTPQSLRQILFSTYYFQIQYANACNSQ